MKLALRYSGSPTARMSGRRRKISPERGGDLAPGQVGAQAEVRTGRPVGDVRVRIAGDVEVERPLEHRLVAVGRVVPHHDLVAGGELLLTQAHPVGSHRAAHVQHRRCVPNDLLDRRHGVGVEVALPLLALLGVIGERQQPMADGVTRCLVPGADQQVEERPQFLGTELLAVGVLHHEARDEIILGAPDPVLGELLGELDELEAHRLEVAAQPLAGLVGDVLRVGAAEQPVGDIEDHLLLAAGDAEHVDDDAQRQQRRHFGDEVALALVGDAGDDLGGEALDVGAQLVEGSWREPLGHDAAHLGVAWLVHGDDRAEVLDEVGRHVDDVDAAGVREVVGSLADLDHVGVPAQGVVAAEPPPLRGELLDVRPLTTGPHPGEDVVDRGPRPDPQVEVLEVAFIRLHVATLASF